MKARGFKRKRGTRPRPFLGVCREPGDLVAPERSQGFFCFPFWFDTGITS